MKFVRNLWEKTLFEHAIKISHDFGTELGRKLRSFKTVPNPSEKIRQKLIRPKIPSENTVFLVVGFNSYFLMIAASDPSTMSKVTTTFQEASQNGLNLARTWAFNDGGYKALQISPGSYNEDIFKVLISCIL
jgi:hypothetical protein